MHESIQEGIRNGVPPFQLCHLLARQRRLLHNGPRSLRLLRPIAVRIPSGTPAAAVPGMQSFVPGSATMLTGGHESGQAMATGAAYAAAGKFQDLRTLALSGGEAFRSRQAAAGTYAA